MPSDLQSVSLGKILRLRKKRGESPSAVRKVTNIRSVHDLLQTFRNCVAILQNAGFECVAQSVEQRTLQSNSNTE